MKLDEINASFFDLNTDEPSPPFYHGTSTNIPINDKLLPPLMTDTIAEVGRKKNLDRVFFTSDYNSAQIYARKAVREFGGDVIIYLVHPVGPIETVQSTQGTTVYAAKWAYVEPLN